MRWEHKEDPELLHTHSIPGGKPITCAAISPNGDTLVAGGKREEQRRSEKIREEKDRTETNREKERNCLLCACAQFVSL